MKPCVKPKTIYLSSWELRGEGYIYKLTKTIERKTKGLEVNDEKWKNAGKKFKGQR